MEEGHVIPVEPDFDVAAFGFGDDDADERAGAEVGAVGGSDLQDDAVARAFDDLPLVLADGDVEAAEVAFGSGDIGESRPFLGVDGRDGGVEIVTGSFEVGFGGFEFCEGGVASEGGEFEVALGGEALFEEFFGSVEVEACGV